MKNLLLVLLACGVWYLVAHSLVSKYWHWQPAPTWLVGVATHAEQLPAPGPKLTFDGVIVRPVPGKGSFVRGRLFAKTAETWVFEHYESVDEIFVEGLDGVDAAQHLTVPMEKVGTAQFAAGMNPGATMEVYRMSKGDFNTPSTAGPGNPGRDVFNKVPTTDAERIREKMGMKGTALDQLGRH